MRGKVPYITQTQKTECGLCCVCMINRYYRNFVTMEELREKLEVGRDGSSFPQLVNLLRNYNFSVKSYNIPAFELRKIVLPAILFWNNNHFVILEAIRKEKYIIVDPAVGRIKVDSREFEEKYTGYAVSPYPNDDFRRDKKKIYNIKYILPYMLENKRLYCIVIAISLLVYLFTLGVPIVIQNVVDSIIEDHILKDYNQFLLLIIFLSIMYCLTNFAKNVMLIKLRASLDRTLNTNIFSHLLKLPYKFFSVRSSGDIIYTLNSSMNIREIFANTFITALINVGTSIAILLYIFLLSRVLGLTALILFAINIVIVSFTRPILSDSSRSIITNQSNVQGIQMETVYGMLGVKMSAIENDVLESWKASYEKYYQKYVENEKISNYVISVNSFLQFLSPTILLLTGIMLINVGKLSMGAIIAIYSLGNTFFGMSNSVIDLWTSFINSNVIFDRLADIIKSEEEKENSYNVTDEIKGNISLEKVSFSYTKDSEYVLQDIDLKIEKGMKVAIVGKSGSGKSTLAKLLVGLFEPTKGKILFDDIDFNSMNKKEVRKQVGIVPQDITLFNKSIYDNIIMNRNNLQLDDVKMACDIAHISEEIEEMPMNYYTEISELGLNLSGGQRQRIALARAIIGKPKILLLDEATSSLDNINERNVSEEIRRMGATQIIIAHRLSTIIDADLIVVVEGGKIVEKGTHDELILKEGQYKKLYSVLG